MPLLSATLLTCEQVLDENGTFSAIRITDLVTCAELADNLNPATVSAQLTVLGVIKFDDQGTHSGQLFLKRPDGETIAVGDPISANLSTLAVKFPDEPRSLALVGKIEVSQKQMGKHELSLTIDGNEAARFSFTLVRVASLDSKPGIVQEGGVRPQ